MATGDSDDIVNRVKHLIPRRWFLWIAPYRDAILGGIADQAAKCYSWIGYARLQIRFKTIIAPWIDIASFDYFGGTIPRRDKETDTLFSIRLVKEILRPRNTRAAILQMLFDLTGNVGTVLEPWNPRDWGGYGLPYSGYGLAIGYGSLSFNNQIFVKAVYNGSGIPNVAGYGTSGSGYGFIRGTDLGKAEYCDITQIQGLVTNAEIYARITQIISAGTTAWTDIVASGQLVINSSAVPIFQSSF